MDAIKAYAQEHGNRTTNANVSGEAGLNHRDVRNFKTHISFLQEGVAVFHALVSTWMHMPRCDVETLERKVREFRTWWRKAQREEYGAFAKDTTPKIHMIFEHIIPFAHLVSGYTYHHSEEGCESLHSKSNDLERRYSCTRNAEEKLEAVANNIMLQSKYQSIPRKRFKK